MSALKELVLKKDKFVSREVGEELILVPLKNSVANMDEMFTLNEVGNFIWQNIDNDASIEVLSNKIAEEFEIDLSTAKKDLEEFIDQLTSFFKDFE
jgi:hypothetical protein